MTVDITGANVRANGIRQHYLAFKSKPSTDIETPLVIVPGITSPAVTWAFVAERLGKQMDTYVLDVRGRGLSEQGSALDYGMDALADDLVEFCRALGLDGARLLGHSMGGRIAAAAIRRAPALFSRVVLVDPPVSGPGRREYPSKLPWYIDSIREAGVGMSAEDMRRYCPSWEERHLALRAEWLHTCDERAVRESFEEFHVRDFHADLKACSIPSMLMRAGKGDVILDDDVREMKELLADLTVVTVTDAGHMIPWDDEEGFHWALSDFLVVPD